MKLSEKTWPQIATWIDEWMDCFRSMDLDASLVIPWLTVWIWLRVDQDDIARTIWATGFVGQNSFVFRKVDAVIDRGIRGALLLPNHKIKMTWDRDGDFAALLDLMWLNGEIEKAQDSTGQTTYAHR